MEEEKIDVKKELFSWIRLIVVAVAIAVVLNNFVLGGIEILSGSMENNMKKGDKLMGARFSYWFSDPERGDIVFFNYPVDDAKGIKNEFVKRVIGLPGDTIVIEDGKIYINGSDEPLDEPYLKEEWVDDNTGYHFEVPEGCYFMMGDNRNCSLDGRFWDEEALDEGVAETQEEAEQFRYVKRKQIFAKALFRYWPLNEFRVYK